MVFDVLGTTTIASSEYPVIQLLIEPIVGLLSGVHKKMWSLQITSSFLNLPSVRSSICGRISRRTI